MLFLAGIFVMSMLVLFSASNQSWHKIDNKLVYTIMALAVMWVMANARPQSVMNFAPPLYAAGVLMLVGVELFGITVNGSTRWLNLGIVRIQPSEIMKTALPMMVAWYFQKYESTLNWRHYVFAVLLIVIPGALVLKQPDLGTAVLIMGAGFFVLFFAGLSWKIIIGGLIAFLASLPVVWNLLHDYQRRRVLTLIDPMQDPLGDGYHIIQSMIAIGSGGPWGKGWLNGSQTQLAGAITLSFFVYVFVNMGMVAGILPVVGVPLPFMSYGGTATVSLAVALGMLMSIGNTKR